MKHPITGRRLTLQTKDKAQTINRHWKLKARLEDQIIERLDIPNNTIMTSNVMAQYSKKFLHKTLNKKGKLLSKSTVKAYTNYFLNFQSDELFIIPVSIFGCPEKEPETVRKYLAQPKIYNNRKSCLSRFFDHCIDLGHIQRNPCQVIKNRITSIDETYMTNMHYIQIMEKLSLNTGFEVCTSM